MRQPHLLCTCVLKLYVYIFIVHFVVRSKHGDASIAIYRKMVGIGCDYYSTSNILFLIHSVSLPIGANAINSDSTIAIEMHICFARDILAH